MQTSPFELPPRLAAVSRGGALILPLADLLTTYCCKGLKRGSFCTVPLSQIEHLFQLHILLTFLFSSFVRCRLASPCLLPSATCLPLLSESPLFPSFSLLPGGRQRHEHIVPGCSPQGSLTRLVIAIAAFPCITRTTGTVP